MAVTNFSIRRIGKNASSNQTETLHLDRTKGRVTGGIHAFKFVDGDTKQHVFFVPSLEISSYGATPERATEMLKICIEQLFEDFMATSADQMYAELRRLGWIKDKHFSKELSKAYVDPAGLLQDFNLEDGKIERFDLVAA